MQSCRMTRSYDTRDRFFVCVVWLETVRTFYTRPVINKITSGEHRDSETGIFNSICFLC